MNRPTQPEVRPGVTIKATERHHSHHANPPGTYVIHSTGHVLDFVYIELVLQFLQQAEASQQTAPVPNPSPETDSQQSPGILVMVAQPPYRLSSEEASKLTIPAFCALWTVSCDMVPD